MRIIISTIITGLVLTACTGSTAVKEGTTNSDLPEWVRKEGKYADGIGAIGSAALDGTGTQIMRYEAKTAARAELALIIEARMQVSISTTNQRLKNSGLGAGDSISVLQTQATVSALAEQAVKKAQAIETWRDPKNKEYNVWMVINSEDLVDESLINDMANKIIKKKLNEASKDHQEKLKIMREELRSQLRKKQR